MTAYRGPLGNNELRVHSGRVTLPVRITQSGPVRGQPRLMVTYQVCTDKVCLAPTRSVLPIRIVAASSSE